MTGRAVDSGLRLLGAAMIVAVIGFLVVPILVTAVMAFDARRTWSTASWNLRWYASKSMNGAPCGGP